MERNFIEENLENYEPKTELGAELKRLALEYERNGGKLLSEDDIEKEVKARRGEIF